MNSLKAMHAIVTDLMDDPQANMQDIVYHLKCAGAEGKDVKNALVKAQEIIEKMKDLNTEVDKITSH